MLPCSLWGAAVVMGFLLHGDRLREMEKKLTNSGPFRELVDKHSIYKIQITGVFWRLCSMGGLACSKSDTARHVGQSQADRSGPAAGIDVRCWGRATPLCTAGPWLCTTSALWCWIC